ncbi:dissimilatory adenylylsulfate reductase alpha subunit precursor [Natranaerovirga hydrolytica]|uniref:Dissimilatory adenylylsulfate reductase alpha subunit n=1 Tax=Natranaerovirga hydrolytica TaxID=680378 RepID=A0A4R1MJ54_9FIRM|nr:adenylyl-sulfate reductase subunit alpha [Natranaerovirga hydrolytica]TCK92477.1 dissimilatory adenylylsulfate reductase alpha subunit precursor [Natranaerovirga hydrolytica]
MIVESITTDVLVIGGGTAGCFNALTLAEHSSYKVLIAEKANIKRSGCLAAGVNAINAYITQEETEESFVEYVNKDSEGIIREDLVYSIAKGLNKATRKIESLGLTILKDEKGHYVSRGKRSIKINGENIKPILAHAVQSKENIEIIQRTQVIDYIIKDKTVIGAIAIALDEEKIYTIYAKAVVSATGGASGIYKPNNPGFSKHKMWYSPFNTGAGYGMGIRAGAEMTGFEMRFIALRCKDTIAPTGTIAQGVKAQQVNAKGEEYVSQYGKPTTYMRLYATVQENLAGRGPCYLQTKGIDHEQEKELFKAYLNMAPAQTLKWIENHTGPKKENVEIEGTEPYIVGGHTASGYWIDIKRRTTLKGLYAIGDVAGGSPKKYVTGCFVEGEIAAFSIIEDIQDKPSQTKAIEDEMTRNIYNFYNNKEQSYTYASIEEGMQKVMDEYAGGISQGYGYSQEKLKIAEQRINELMALAYELKVNHTKELGLTWEVIDRLYVAKVLIKHLEARKETRWRCYQENKDYPEKKDAFLKYVNSIYKDNKVHIVFKELVKKEDVYEHSY